MKNFSMNFSKTRGLLRVGLFGVFLMMFISIAQGQSIEELDQFLGSEKAGQLGIDQEYLFGRSPYVLITSSRDKFPEGQSPTKVIVEGNAIDRLDGSDRRFNDVDLIHWKIKEAGDKTVSLDPAKIGTLENLKVILILSSIPLSKSEVERMFSRFTDSGLTILYQYSEPV